MNCETEIFLNRYVESPDPRYAVVIKGDWGCGKTHFIKGWVDAYKERLRKNEVEITPVYVSLYGMEEKAEINRAINRVLHPFLTGKSMESLKKFANFAGKVVLRTNLGLGDKNADDSSYSIEASLDPSALFASNEKDELFSNKLLIFDDIERCLIPMKQLLGHINKFVEHGGCHAIIIGDFKKLDETSLKEWKGFKEKTVGREFELQTEIEKAVDYFLGGEDLPVYEWLTSQRGLIIDTFRATGCNNLRLLRQSLSDISHIYREIEAPIGKWKEIARAILASYILTVSEFRGREDDDLATYIRLRGMYLLNDEKAENIRRLNSRYEKLSEKYGLPVLQINNLNSIACELDNGFGLKQYLEHIIGLIEEEVKQPSGMFSDYLSLENDAFNAEYACLEEGVANGEYTNAFQLGRAAAWLLHFDNKGIQKINPRRIEDIAGQMLTMLKTASSKEELYQIKNLFFNGVAYCENWRCTNSGKEIEKRITDGFKLLNAKLKNYMEMSLEELSDSNVEELCNIGQKQDPETSRPYHLTAIFKNIDANKFAERILKLKNKSLESLLDFFDNQYTFFSSAEDMKCYATDVPVLRSIEAELFSALDDNTSVRVYLLSQLIGKIDKIIETIEPPNPSPI